MEYLKNMLLLAVLTLTTLSCNSSKETNSGDTNLAAEDENVTQDTLIRFADITTVQAKELMQKNPDLIILDVRTPQEIAGGKIEGAIEIDYESPDFSARIGALDKEKDYLVYCASGGRSGYTKALMMDSGFKNAYNMLGGYNKWKTEQ